jgi:DNA-binding response OmpR family regulator
MPDMNGRDVVAQIRTLRPRVPVLFMSAHADEDTVERFGLKGPKMSFIAKPFDVATLSAKIREVLAVK